MLGNYQHILCVIVSIPPSSSDFQVSSDFTFLFQTIFFILVSMSIQGTKSKKICKKLKSHDVFLGLSVSAILVHLVVFFYGVVISCIYLKILACRYRKTLSDEFILGYLQIRTIGYLQIRTIIHNLLFCVIIRLVKLNMCCTG